MKLLYISASKMSYRKRRAFRRPFVRGRRLQEARRQIGAGGYGDVKWGRLFCKKGCAQNKLTSTELVKSKIYSG